MLTRIECRRNVHAEVAAPEDEITRQAAQWNPGHHQQPGQGNQQADDDQQATHLVREPLQQFHPRKK
jgi:hypothetical protein